MPAAPLLPCRTCRALTDARPPYCPRCQPGSPRAQRRRSSWTRTSRTVRARWLALYGPWCPGWQRPGHWVTAADLTVDHVEGLASGPPGQPLAVLCRDCNASKGGR